MAVFNYKIERKIKASCNKCFLPSDCLVQNGPFSEEDEAWYDYYVLKKYHIAFVVFHPQLFLRYVHLSAGMVDAMILRMQASPHLRVMGVFGGGEL
jgi:hypothetical protein